MIILMLGLWTFFANDKTVTMNRSFHTISRTLQDTSKISSVKRAFESANSIKEIPRKTIDNRFIPDLTNKKRYNPFDFSIASQRFQSKIYNVKKSKIMENSSFNSSEINPLDFYTLPHLLSNYVNTSGQILHRSVTGLSAKKQKQVSKAIRRARSFGFMSCVANDVSTFPKRGDSL